MAKACKAYRATTKGKVERPFRLIREDFFLGRNIRRRLSQASETRGSTPSATSIVSISPAQSREGSATKAPSASSNPPQRRAVRSRKLQWASAMPTTSCGTGDSIRVTRDLIPHWEPATIVIKSVNPDYRTHDRGAEEVNIIGRVIWSLRRL